MRSNDAASILGGQSSFPDDPLEFFENHMHPRNRPWLWDGREYLKDIIATDAQEKVVQKAAQVGLSTTAIGESLRRAGQGLNVGYYLPDYARMKVFVQKRMDPLISADPDLSRAIVELKDEEDPAAKRRGKNADNQRLKQFGSGTILTQGLQNLVDAKSDDLDFTILDEFDELDEGLVPFLEDRLMASDYKLSLQLSQASVPDYGISEAYDLSDQRVYKHRCPRCRKWHVLEDEWPANLFIRTTSCSWHPSDAKCPHCASADDRDVETKIACLHCGARLRETDSEVQTEWVAAHPGRAVAGWRLSQLYGPKSPPHYLWTRWKKTEKSSKRLQNFHISVLGKPFAGDRQPVSSQIIQHAAGDWLLGLHNFLSRLPADARPLILGAADIGDDIYAGKAVHFDGVTCAVELKVFTRYMRGDKEISAFDQLRDFFRDTDYFVFDFAPERSEARKLLRTDGLTGAGCMFPTNCQELVAGTAEESLDVGLRLVKQDRTTAIDDMADSLKHGTLRLPSMRCEVMNEVQRHCARLRKDLNLRTARWEYVRGVENHWGLMLVYLDLAVQTAPLYDIGPRLPLGALSSFTLGGSIVGGQSRSRYDY